MKLVSILTIIIAILFSNGISNVNNNNVQDYVNSDPASVCEFIDDNFNKFVDEYNNMASKEKLEIWDAKFIENQFEIDINECGKEYKGIFLDFDADNGYAIIGNDYTFLDFVTDGVSPYEGIETDKYYFSTASGYMYYKDNICFGVNESNNADSSYIYDNITGQSYNGQEEGEIGCGKIKDPYLYVNDKYGSGWVLSSSRSLDMIGYTQDELTCYLENEIEDDLCNVYTEANCWVVSAYNVLQYMADNYWTRMPKNYKYSLYYPSISEPRIYSLYYDSNGNNKTKLLRYNNNSQSVYQTHLKRNVFSFPKLYNETREFVNSKFGKINDGSIWNTSTIIESMANKYGYHVNSVEYVAWVAHADSATKKIDQGYPLLWSTLNGTYDSHTMAVCGYNYYSRTSGWWIFKTTKYKLFYAIKDGHATETRYYDMSGHVGFSAIIALEF
ncbi:MAG: hypothetical protein IJF75_02930 [Clostridia bacterium]|nr:hypothetical protein [Clostridia bacterium]